MGYTPMSKSSSILIIDDSAKVRKQVVETLRDANLFDHYREACNGLEGFRALISLKPDLVICDMEMPHMDGLKFINLVNTREELKDVPIIILTGKTSIDLRIRALDQGAVDYMTKPFHSRELVSRVKVQLKMKSLQDELKRSNELLKALSDTDALTRLYNRRFLMEDLGKEMERANRMHNELSLVMFDVDHFKNINDTYGHLNGDIVLMGIAEVCQVGLRCYDIAARYGGEEFVLLLPDTPLNGGLHVAGRLREAVQKMVFPAPMQTLTVSVSLGVATFPSPLVCDADSLLRQADLALYRAKQSGRNRVEAMAPGGVITNDYGPMIAA